MRPMTPSFDLYFWPTPNGYKISIMLEELGVDYQLVPINITEGEQHESGHKDDNDEPPGVSCNWWLRVVLRIDDLIVW